MKGIALLCAGITTISLISDNASAAGASRLWPDAQDRAICDPIVSALQMSERKIELAEADVAKTAGEKGSAQAQAGQDDAPSEAELTSELSAMLQACSFDGKAMAIQAASMRRTGDADGAAAVDRIMGFTGLPPNFVIVEGEVDNAAAMVVLDADGIPRRIIAYSRKFMQEVSDATGDAAWPATSILAHEIGHHLSGHTLMPGGSQPPTELEADKFSGFVLFKMGATLQQARQAIATLIAPEDGPTHPGRAKRLDALQAGWLQSCRQQRQDCNATTVVAALQTGGKPSKIDPPQTSARPSEQMSGSPLSPQAPAPMPDIPGPIDIDIPAQGGRAEPIGPAVIDPLPKLQADATPSKFDRFVYDEVGVFDPSVRDKLQQTAFQFAAAANVEVVTVVTKDLQGRDPDQYAFDFMRQMRVGKMDVGNGAVLVVAPGLRKVGVALGPGLRVLFENDPSPGRRLNDFLTVVSGGGDDQRASSTIAGAAYRIMTKAKTLEWQVRYPSFASYRDASRQVSAERARATTPYDPAKDPVANKLLRLEAIVVTSTPDMSDRSLMINEPRSRHVGPAMQVRTAEGEDIILYVNSDVAKLMTVPLTDGRRYSFIARDTILKTGAPQLDLISYDLLD